MRTNLLAPTLVAAALVLPATSASAAIHEVAPGETLSGIAVADGLPLATLAAANGLPLDAQVVAGQVLTIPAAGAAATVAAPSTSTSTAPASASAGDGDGDADDVASGTAPASATSSASAAAGDGDADVDDVASGTAAPASGAPPALGAYTVQPGDTLSALALRSRVPAAQIAYMNGLPVDGTLLSGTVIKLPTGSPLANTAADDAVPSVVPAASPSATPIRLTASEVSAIAAANGVPGSLAAAIAWQESGFNNAFVSPANARGVMQLLPGTWNYVQSTLIPGQRLDPSSAADNVRAGALYLGQLLRESGGDPATAVAAYYQGLASVRAVGMLPETRRYVANVLALQSRFGG
jgi:LysM repeat protein